jgi:hypothetical protein
MRRWNKFPIRDHSSLAVDRIGPAIGKYLEYIFAFVFKLAMQAMSSRMSLSKKLLAKLVQSNIRIACVHPI